MGSDRRNRTEPVARVRPDRKGRITLGKLAKGVSSYLVRVEEGGGLRLEPFKEIPAGERWELRNPLSRSEITRAVSDAAAGRARQRTRTKR